MKHMTRSQTFYLLIARTATIFNTRFTNRSNNVNVYFIINVC